MWRVAGTVVLGLTIMGVVVGQTVLAQDQPVTGSRHSQMQGSPAPHGADMHTQHMEMMRKMATTTPMMSGQDAFGALTEVVRILEADPATDWTKVDIERLRQHLIDMNEVVLRSEVKQTPVPGGLAMEIKGTGRTEQAIRAMVVPHATELDRMPDWSATTEAIAGGVRLTVIAKRADDAKLVARIRGLGFAGLITEGAHHQPHHLAMARGEALPGHAH
ncbi:MAG: hypothetical protein C5B48_12460 [Candidatus Rokuibacteriota bacterium]|nr:MAG: hypothetical protein C5B48_12460 [Candidatus Rokubacteria bacterium]